VELGGALFALGTSLGLDGTLLTRIRLLGVPFGGCRVLGRRFTLTLGFVLSLRGRHRVSLRLLLMPSHLSANALALAVAHAATPLGRAADAHQQEGGDEYNGDHYGDYGDR
jgi:hypothetical protein